MQNQMQKKVVSDTKQEETDGEVKPVTDKKDHKYRKENRNRRKITPSLKVRILLNMNLKERIGCAFLYNHFELW